MTLRKLKRLDLNRVVITKLEEQNILTCKDVLTLSDLQILNIRGVNRKEKRELLKKVNQACAPSSYTAYDIYTAKQNNPNGGFLPLSLPTIDFILQGGLPLGGITEIAGPPSVGKTQFCFQLSILATLPTEVGGLNGSVAFIDTESSFSAERLKEIAIKKFPNVFTSHKELTKLLCNIFVHRAPTTISLQEIIENMEYEVIRKGIKLIIIDSIASLMRKEFGSADISSIVERNRILAEQAAVLKAIAKTFGLVVFVTNQICTYLKVEDDIGSDLEEEDDPDVSDSLYSSQDSRNAAHNNNMVLDDGETGSYVSPALGITWAHCINTRLVAEFRDQNRRKLAIAKSPVAPNKAVHYIISASGLELVDDMVEDVCMDPDVINLQTKCDFVKIL